MKWIPLEEIEKYNVKPSFLKKRLKEILNSEGVLHMSGAFGFCDELPFMGCMWWILALLIFLILVGLFYLWILKILKRKYKRV